MELIPDDDPRLHTKCDYINLNKLDWDLHSTVSEMFEVMKAKRGVGLAAPQVGITKRFFIMSYDDKDWVCINPKILFSSKDEISLGEGCLSYPSTYMTIYRPREVKVEFRTLENRKVTKRLDGILARIFQHEYDHINGIVFHDRFDEQKGVDYKVKGR